MLNHEMINDVNVFFHLKEIKFFLFWSKRLVILRKDLFCENFHEILDFFTNIFLKDVLLGNKSLGRLWKSKKLTENLKSLAFFLEKKKLTGKNLWI